MARGRWGVGGAVVACWFAACSGVGEGPLTPLPGGVDGGASADAGAVGDAGVATDAGPGAVGDAGVATDAGPGAEGDAGVATDAGPGAEGDAGVPTDAGPGAEGDAGVATDAGPSADAGATGDAGMAADAGRGPDAGGAAAGPWPNAPLTVYGPSNGILELPVVGAQPDDAQNLWLVTHAALYLLRPGETTFRRFTDADGLHLALSMPPGITAVAGGAAGEAFVGYEGYVDDSPNTDTQAQKDMGKFDQVAVQANGALAVTRYNVHDSNSLNYWENRSVRRLLYDHAHHPGNLYVGFNHGVDRVYGGAYVDHVHPEVCVGGCAEHPSELRIGEWRGLCFDPQGSVWMAGEYTAGLLGWTQSLVDWIDNGMNPFIVAFGDPYPPSQPVFQPPAEGDQVDLRAVAVAPNGLVWFASGPQWTPSDPEYGLASYDPGTGQFTYYDPVQLGFGTEALMDMVALPDGRLVIGTEASGLRLWSPPNGALQAFTTANGLPGDQIQLMYLDLTVTPPALYVGTDGGLAVLRLE